MRMLFEEKSEADNFIKYNAAVFWKRKARLLSEAITVNSAVAIM